MDQTFWVNLGWQLAGWGAAALIVIGGPLLVKAGNDYLKAHTSAAQYNQIRNYATDLVQAAEQYLNSSDGKAKRAWVLTALQTYLASRGWAVPVGMLDAVVESGVKNMNEWHYVPAAPTADTPKP